LSQPADNHASGLPSGDHDYARLPSDQKLLIDRLCSRFEAALKAGGQPKAEAVLKKLPANMRMAALGELLPLEANYRLREGKPLTLPELEQRFPECQCGMAGRMCPHRGPGNGVWRKYIG
jgi:hypothetical protein